MQQVARVPALLVILLLAWGNAESRAQKTDAVRGQRPHFCATSHHDSFDRGGLAFLYCGSPSGMAFSLESAHASARPVFYGAVPAAWGGAILVQDPSLTAAAYRLSVSQGLTYGLVLGAKHVVGRPRPYVNLPLEARTKRNRPPDPAEAHLSFPSGHAGVSAALATSWSLSYPRWYVIAPGAVWATGVALSRVYLGVHYPSDVLMGAALGVGVALLVHQLRTIVTPPPFRGPTGSQRVRGIPVMLRLQF